MLFITAAVAFASYLIPKWASSSYGWSTWWSSLLKGAVLAPAVMFFLWATITVGSKLQVGPTNALGTFSANPTNATGVNALASYIIILGLLFLSFKMSSLLSSKIAGFNFASMATALPFTAGARFLLAPALRQGAGLLGYKYQASREAQAQDARDKAARLRILEAGSRDANRLQSAARYGKLAQSLENRADKKMTRASRGEAVAKSKMNLMDTGAMKAFTKNAGITGFASGSSDKTTKGYGDQVKARVEESEKRAAKLAPSKDDNDKARKRADRQVRDQRKLALAQLQQTAENAKATENLGRRLEDAMRDAQAQQNTSSLEKARIASDATINAQTKRGLMRAEDAKIERAKGVVQAIQNRIDFHDKPVKDHQAETDKLAEEAGKKIVAAMGESAENIAEQIGRKSGDVLTRAWGSAAGVNADVGKKARAAYKRKRNTASLARVLADIQADSGSTPPATP